MELSPTVKKILLGTLLVLVTGAIAYLLYFVFFRTAPTDTTVNQNTNGDTVALPNLNDLLANANRAANENETVDTQLPGIDDTARGGLTEATSLTPGVDAQNSALSKSGDVRYYDPADGGFYKVDSNGNIVLLGEKKFPSADNVTWAPTKDEVVIEFPDGSNVYYDIAGDEQVTLPAEFAEFDFSPTSNQIAFKYEHEDPDRRVLAISNPDGSAARTVEELGIYGYRATVDWSPTGKVIAHWSEFSGLEQQDVGFIGLKDENFKGASLRGRGLETKYSPSGLQMLYSSYISANDYIPTVKIVDADGNDIGKNNQDLSLPTFAHKCAFNSDSDALYCGVPSESIYAMGLEPDLLNATPDDIYKVDLNTGLKTRIAVPVDENGNAEYRVDSMFVTGDDSTLVFQDGNTGELIKVEL